MVCPQTIPALGPVVWEGQHRWGRPFESPHSSCLEQHRVPSSKLLEVVVCQWRGWELQLAWPACQLGLLGHVRRGLCSIEAGNWDANGAKGWRRPWRHCPGGRRLGQWAGIVYHVRTRLGEPRLWICPCL